MKVTEKIIRTTVTEANMGVLKTTPIGLTMEREGGAYTLRITARASGRQSLIDEGLTASEVMCMVKGFIRGVVCGKIPLIQQPEIETDGEPTDGTYPGTAG